MISQKTKTDQFRLGRTHQAYSFCKTRKLKFLLIDYIGEHYICQMNLEMIFVYVGIPLLKK